MNTIAYTPPKRMGKTVRNKSRYSTAPPELDVYPTGKNRPQTKARHTMSSMPQSTHLNKFSQHLSDQVRSSILDNWNNP